MSLPAIIKGTGIATAYHLTNLIEPYQAFTRAADPKDNLKLWDKAARFDAIIREKFMLRGGTIQTYRIPLPEGSPMDLGDQALWHGVYTGSEAIQFAIDKSPGTGGRVVQFVQGLADQQPGGMLIRGIDESGSTMLNCSNDSGCGHLFGLFGVLRCGPVEAQAQAVALIEQWTDQIQAHGGALHNPDGNPTTYGALDQGWKSDPLRMTLLLAILRTAYEATKSPTFIRRYQELKSQHYEMLAYPFARFLWLHKVTDAHRAAIQLHILAELDPHDPVYRWGLKHLMDYARKSGNIWMLALCGRHLKYEEGDRDLAIKVLSEFSVEEKTFNVGKRLSEVIPEKERVKWGGEYVSRQPYPVHRRTSQDFYFSRHPWSLDGRGQGERPDSMLNGGDFLAAYRLGLMTGLFNEGD